MKGEKNNSGKRNQKVTTVQKELYVSFLESNKAMRLKKPSEQSVQHLWKDLAEKLNAVLGPSFNPEQWKKVFDNWRYSLKSKLRAEISSRQRTGGGPEVKSSLTDLEDRALSIWGKQTVEGITNLGVAGFLECEDQEGKMFLTEVSQPLDKDLQERGEDQGRGEQGAQQKENGEGVQQEEQEENMEESYIQPKKKRKTAKTAQSDEDLAAVWKESLKVQETFMAKIAESLQSIAASLAEIAKNKK